MSEQDARTRRDVGMEESAEHAGEEWRSAALALAHDYCISHRLVFVDDLWKWGLESGASDRALGVVVQSAARRGWIEKLTVPEYGGYICRPSVRSNLSPKPLWRSLIYRGGEA